MGSVQEERGTEGEERPKVTKDIIGGPMVRIYLPMQEPGLIPAPEDSTCHRATRPMHCNYLSLLLAYSPCSATEKLSHHHEKPAHYIKEQLSLTPSIESPCAATKTQYSQKKWLNL